MIAFSTKTTGFAEPFPLIWNKIVRKGFKSSLLPPAAMCSLRELCVKCGGAKLKTPRINANCWRGRAARPLKRAANAWKRNSRNGPSTLTSVNEIKFNRLVYDFLKRPRFAELIASCAIYKCVRLCRINLIQGVSLVATWFEVTILESESIEFND